MQARRREIKPQKMEIGKVFEVKEHKLPTILAESADYIAVFLYNINKRGNSLRGSKGGEEWSRRGRNDRRMARRRYGDVRLSRE